MADQLYRVSLAQLYEILGHMEPVRIGPILEECYKKENEAEWHNRISQQPHGRPWHVSFHASRFPGDDPMACPRKAMYDFMAIPAVAPFNTFGRTIMDAGKDAEEQFVWRFSRGGVLVSATPDSPVQTGYADTEHWLTVSSDAVILPPGTNRPHCVEIKGKDKNAIDEMRGGFRKYEPAHYRQLCCQIVLANRYSKQLWPEYDEVNAGTLMYFARDIPAMRFEYLITLDEAKRVYHAGIEKLKQWKQLFLDGTLPPRDPAWRWTDANITPCHYCDVKALCKADVKAKVTKIADSITIQHARDVYGDAYDPAKIRQAVLDTWKEKDPR